MSAKFRFFKAGSVDQLKISVPEDLEAVETLDTKLWLATSMPVAGIDFDARTLALVDSDGDGRIRVPEIRAAVKFVREQLKNSAPLFEGTDKIAVQNLADKTLAETAGIIFGNDAEPDLATLEKTFENFESQPFCGNGRLTAAAAGDDKNLAELINDIAAAAGTDGVSAGILEQFLKDADQKISWENEVSSKRETILPLGEKTVPAAAAVSALRAKIDDYFARVHLADFDASSIEKLNPGEAAVAAVAQTENLTGTETAAMPVARIKAGECALRLDSGINPAWTTAAENFKTAVLEPLKLSTKSLEENDWEKIKALFAPYFEHEAKKPAALTDAVPAARLEAVLRADPAGTLAPLFAKDAEAAPRRNALKTLIKLACFSKNLVPLLQNFVSFEKFYNRDPQTVFLNGKLYIGGKALSLCINVADAGTHAGLAGTASNAFLIYADCVRKSDGKSQTVCALLGDGGSDNLQTGMNGIFIDKAGNDYDAKIVKIVEQSVSLRQAFWSPYVKIGKFIEKQISGFAADREKKVDAKLTEKVETAALPAGTPSAPKAPFDIGKFMGVIAAAGLALGAVGTAIVTMAKSVAEQPWVLPLVIVLTVLIISLPSVFITAVKLRKRTVSPILNANSWAINTNARLSISLCKAYTELPKKPAGTKKCFFKRPAFIIPALLILLCAAAAGTQICFRASCQKAEEPAAETVPAQETVPAETTQNPAPAE